MSNSDQSRDMKRRWANPAWAAKASSNMRKAHARRRQTRPRPYPIELVAGVELRLLPLSTLLEGLEIDDRRTVYGLAAADVEGFVRIETPEELSIVAFGVNCRFATIETAVDYAGVGVHAFALV